MEYTGRDIFVFAMGMIFGTFMSIGIMIIGQSNLFGYVGK